MMKKLLFSMLFLFMGVGMYAQSVAEETMNELFNDSTNLPYGWFTEGWAVKDGAIQSNAASGFSFDPEKMGGDGEKFDISKLLESFMGGGSNDNYLLTPPLVVREGESLIFKAKKGEKDDSGMGGGGISFGSSDSTFVVDYTVYSHNQWLRLADFTTELTSEYKEFTISNIPAGQYRFRFKAADAVMIDSVAGYHFDCEAPDIYIVENDARAKDIDFSLCKEDSTRSVYIINTATGTLAGSLTSENNALFSLSESEMSIKGADSLKVDVTFHVAAGTAGKNQALLSFTPSDERVWAKSLYAYGVITQPDVWVEDFNNNVQPKGFFTEGWKFCENVATTQDGGMMAMFGMGTKSFLMTPPLIVNDSTEVLLFAARKGSSDDGMAGMGSMFGGGNSSIIIEKSVYGSNVWEKIKEYTEPLDSAYRVLWVSDVAPGEYRFRIIASDSIVVDSIAGYHFDNNAPDMYVLHNNTAAGPVNYGMPQADSTEVFGVVNTGTGSLQVNAMVTNEKDFAISNQNLNIESGDTAFVDATFKFDQESVGVHSGILTFVPSITVLSPQYYPLTAYSTYADAWKEDFEPEFLQDDETEPIDLPEGWLSTGWEVRLPSSGGGLMDMLGGIMGGSDEPKTWMATTESADYELITPNLQAKQGDVLRFEAEIGGGGIMAMAGMFMGGGAGNQLNVFYSLDDGNNWTYYNTFVQNGYVYFIAPYSGIYRLRFTSPQASVDNFYGFRKPIETVVLSDEDDAVNAEVFANYDGKTVNVFYDRALYALNSPSESVWTPRAYTICLPYDHVFSNYEAPGKIKLYQLSYIDKYYNQFIFSAVSDSVKAGQSYLAVVENGTVMLNAIDAKLQSQATTIQTDSVCDYETWFFEDQLKRTGLWTGNFTSISATEADNKNMFCLLEDGSWARLTSKDNPDAKLNPFRGYFLSDEVPNDENQARAMRGNDALKVYRTLFSNVGVPGMSDGKVPDATAISYSADIPTPSSITDINSATIKTIEADGSSRYFDLQGRMLNGKPTQSTIFVKDGKKFAR